MVISQLSIVKGYWLSTSCQWLLTIINGYQLLSMVIGYQWLSRILNGFQSIINGYQMLLVINKLSMVIKSY